MPTKLEPVRCRCGRKVDVCQSANEEFFWVKCGRTGLGTTCWCGPDRSTRLDSIRAWNRGTPKR